MILNWPSSIGNTLIGTSTPFSRIELMRSSKVSSLNRNLGCFSFLTILSTSINNNISLSFGILSLFVSASLDSGHGMMPSLISSSRSLFFDMRYSAENDCVAVSFRGVGDVEGLSLLIYSLTDSFFYNALINCVLVVPECQGD